MATGPDRNKMAHQHEQFLAELTGGRMSRGSGSTWQDPADGRANRLTEEFAFAFEGKSTTQKSLVPTLDMLAKLREQAGGERPLLGLRWYATEDLTQVAEDWVAIPAADFGEMLAALRQAAAEAEAAAAQERAMQAKAIQDPGVFEPWPPAMPGPVPPPPSEVLRGGYPPDILPPPHELWPCQVIDSRHDPHSPTNDVTNKGYEISDSGMVTEFTVTSVRVEPMSEARRHLFVNEILVRRGQLWIDGRLEVQVGGPLF